MHVPKRETALLFDTNSALKEIRGAAAQFERLGRRELKAKSLELKYVAMRGQLFSQNSHFFRACGIVTTAVRRCLNLEYYDVQLMGGIQMARGNICEMKTGEGKTLTAAIPAYCYGLTGLGCHVVTVNDYLAQRDLDILAPVYELLGLSCGAILGNHSPDERAHQYACDITYGTAKELGFDFLRDRLKQVGQTAEPVAKTQRPLHAVLIDEADSILLDEARTPLIIGTVDEAGAQRTQNRYRWAATHAADFVEDRDYTYDEDSQQVHLTTAGFQKMGQLPQTEATQEVSTLELMGLTERAILARQRYCLDKHYAIQDGNVVIVDEFTGRLAEGRQWQNGIHQSIEAKEGLEISKQTESAASITMQHFFRLYRHVCGMTGTAWSSRGEIKRVYGKTVVRIPTNRPVRRKQLPVRVFRNSAAKFDAIAHEVIDCLRGDRAVLIGTRSVAQSERLSAVLQNHGIAHNVLNARFLAEEAEIVAQAGQPQSVTVATNMAGRGTDILLDETVRKAGGLYVILTELHESSRIDQQLIGRCSRQGDPGSYRIFVSLDDEILALGFHEAGVQSLRQRYAKRGDGDGELSPQLFRRFLRAQAITERRHSTDRLVQMRQESELLKKMQESGEDYFVAAIR